MKKLLVALAIAVPLFIGMPGFAAVADRPTREGEPWWVTGGHGVTVLSQNAFATAGPFGDDPVSTGDRSRDTSPSEQRRIHLFSRTVR